MGVRWLLERARWRRRRPRTSSIVEECAAYLDGEYESLLRRRHEPAPAWVALNRLAHGSLAQVRAASRPARSPWWWWRRPERSTRELADRVLQLARNDPDRLLALQHAVLIPLELQLASRAAPAPAPGEVIARTFVALRAARP